MQPKIIFVIVLSALSIFFGILSAILGVLSTIQAPIWMAHTISPLWSGFFVSFIGTLLYLVDETIR
jgi:hypothetical protein